MHIQNERNQNNSTQQNENQDYKRANQHVGSFIKAEIQNLILFNGRKKTALLFRIHHPHIALNENLVPADKFKH